MRVLRVLILVLFGVGVVLLALRHQRIKNYTICTKVVELAKKTGKLGPYVDTHDMCKRHLLGRANGRE